MYHYLTENSRKSEETDPLYVKWEAWNSLVMSWLMHSMLPNISRLLLTTAQEIWILTAMSQTYSQIENDVQVYELVTREHDTKQRSLAEYYAELRAIWPEIDFVEDSKLIMLLKRWSINSRFNKLRFLSFLVVLNQDYDQVRSKIIGRSPFPTLSKLMLRFRVKNLEEMLWFIIISKKNSNAYCATKRNEKSKSEKVERRKCTRIGHIKYKCWILHGWPNSQRGRSGSNRHMQISNSVENISGPSELNVQGLSVDELTRIRNFINHLKSSSNSISSGPAHSPNSGIMQNQSGVIK